MFSVMLVCILVICDFMSPEFALASGVAVAAGVADGVAVTVAAGAAGGVGVTVVAGACVALGSDMTAGAGAGLAVTVWARAGKHIRESAIIDMRSGLGGFMGFSSRVIWTGGEVYPLKIGEAGAGVGLVSAGKRCPGGG
jgi:hypothetical protein